MTTKIQQYRKAFLPSASWLLALAGVVILVGTYFLVTQYSDNFIEQEGIAAFEAAEKNALARLLVFVPWAAWVDRALDFFFWGAIAAVVIVGAWAFSASRTSLANHKMVQKFQNFNGNTGEWNQQFFTAVALKALLAFLACYVVGAVMVRLLPGLSAAISVILYERSAANIMAGVFQAILLWLSLVLIATCIKMFGRIQPS